MATKDVLDQIRDLQSFIDDFAAETGTPTTPNDEKTEIYPPSPLTIQTVLQKPNEIELEEQHVHNDSTNIEQVANLIDKPSESSIFEKTIQSEPKNNVKEQVEEGPQVIIEKEKTLVEQPVSLSILSYDLNLSNDFSDLVNHFKDLKVSPVEIKPTFAKEEKAEVESPAIKALVVPPYTVSNSSFLFSDAPETVFGKTHSRRNSTSSKKSQKSQKSQRSQRSAKRLQEKKLLQQQKLQQQQSFQVQPKQQQKYVERSYDEMMRIPDIYERLAFYEKTLDLCLKTESPFAAWSKFNTAKGKPTPLLEGYVPPVRSPEFPASENSFGSMSSSFSGSISLFLKKAGSQTIQKHPENKSHLLSSHKQNNPMKTPSNSGSSIFGRSISRLNLSRSTQIPRYDQNMLAPMTPSISRFTPLNRRKLSMDKMGNVFAPLSTDHTVKTPRISSSTPNTLGNMQNNNSKNTNTNSSLNYMMNILPQIDVRILQSALDEAKGDPMVAISIAVSQSKIENAVPAKYCSSKRRSNLGKA